MTNRAILLAILTIAALTVAPVSSDAKSGALVKGEQRYEANDFVAALKLFKLACRGRDPEGCFWAGDMLRRGQGGPQDHAGARSHYDAACRGGLVAGCLNAGVMFRDAMGGPPDKVRARDLFDRGCRGGDVNACFNAGVMFEEGEGGPQDQARARSSYQRGCDRGDSGACSALGTLFYTGEGGPQDLARARDLFDQTCKQNHAQGCYNLGFMLERGDVGAPDLARARGLYDRACRGGYINGCLNLGMLLLSGQGGGEDKGGARKLFEQVCRAGGGQGCANLAVMLLAGAGGPEDKAGARRLFEQACTGGHAVACYSLAVMLENGEGGAADSARARAFYDQACKGAYEAGCASLARLAAKPGRCTLAEVAQPYIMGGVRINCRVTGQRLSCCRNKRSRSSHVRPESYRSFDPLDPPRRLPRPEEEGYRPVEPECDANSLSLELQGDEAVGWKDLNAEPDRRRLVRLPLDENCRLRDGTLQGLAAAGEPDTTLFIRFDLGSADVKAGQPETQYEIGMYWLKKNRHRYAITHFTAAARDGHAKSQYELAKIFEEGASSVRPNLDEADRLYALAAAQGLEEARVKMARRDTAKKNLQELIRQAEAGDADKQHSLALLYGTGKAVPLDWGKTVYWLQRASEQNHARAMNDLGWIYGRGVGDVKRDEAAGRALLEKSAALGCDWALINLARMTYRGEEDVASSASTRARAWLQQARKSSDPKVVREANYWLSLINRDRSAVARRNTIERRRDSLDAMQRSFQQGADDALNALIDIQ